MKILYLQGGLGNQMFQYAYLRHLEKKGYTKIWLDASAPSLNHHTGFELRRVFPEIGKRKQVMPYWAGRALHIAGVVLNRLLGTEIESEGTDKLWISGYWQESAIADSVRDELLREFAFTQINDTVNTELRDKIVATTSVSIHVRRGDYLMPANVGTHGNICTLDYYRRAIEHINREVENPQFILFSDDPQWVKENLDLRGAIIVKHNSGRSAFRDMQLMSLCRHNIIANSSFSWWGAWLNRNEDKIVVAPAKWLQTSTSEFDKNVTPADWKRL